MPFSANFDTKLFIVQKSVRLDLDRLEAVCARWIGHPLDERLRFELRPFSDGLERIWRQTLSFGWSVEEVGLPLANAAKATLDEYLLTVLLHHHPHNYSEELLEPAQPPVPGVLRRAERFVLDNAREPITVSDVADHLGLSLCTLQAGFRQWRSNTPRTFLRQTHLQLARDALRAAEFGTDVTTIALRYGLRSGIRSSRRCW